MRAANAELIQMYWEIGAYISSRVKDGGWGKSVVTDFSEFLQARYPGTKGFSAQNIWRIKQFYETYKFHKKERAVRPLTILKQFPNIAATVLRYDGYKL